MSSVTRKADSVVQVDDRSIPLSPFMGLPAALPSFRNEGEKYRGLLSVDEVSSFILKENSGKRPLYHFVVDNFPKVLKGLF